MISGGIDSPVAAYVMAEAGADVVLLHMDNTPYEDGRSLENVKELAQQLRQATGQEMPLYSAMHGPSQARIGETCETRYQCVMCKRTMQRTAKELAGRLGCSGVVMGDSLGQVASQTLRNIRAENVGLDFPVLRPLIGYDKLEIEEIAKSIGTYEISIRPAVGCTIVPKGPVTEAELPKIRAFDISSDIGAIVSASADSAVRIS
ncbi:MAG: tRNA 4-thiouridine(8) synthase ThiI [Candidatus Methanomethylophilaceae archaeon]|nr:tRNA 4-thiouridine(8) synthase ThiI [Candidatus Methanomethylophilaceae archaeon]MDD2935699.1 tRNA 4-thiouridine(8) synthase ThiI [Candidatus Methanomethylophilaceae archaeon]MDD3351630.1 tRNA 4-thiouridine(8) synthase ThiI [Candidatus Methanomethylophilaceae archaeon]MDD3986892.1 tRNA 4-thiouridine(8) synthase ThiI [Candidatus Methanomethylophilaceae archaeon]MDD4708967.1 tRNA 4-thiouridine(8) synthase ThiI [Candidatus Methanomethylophilaceae archaeon]